MEVKIRQLSEFAKLPEYKTAGSSGMDVCASEDACAWHDGGIAIVPTGIAFNIPEGYEIQVRPRSGLATKGITVLNSPGTIDQDFTGELKIILANFGNNPFTIKKGDRIAQIVLCPVAKIEWKMADVLEETERGANGFGSTGIK